MNLTLTCMPPRLDYEALRKLLWDIERDEPDAFEKVFYQSEVDVPQVLSFQETVGDTQTALNLPLTFEKKTINFLSPARHPRYDSSVLGKNQLLPSGKETLVIPPNYKAIYEQAQKNNVSLVECSVRHMVLTGSAGIGTWQHPVPILYITLIRVSS